MTEQEIRAAALQAAAILVAGKDMPSSEVISYAKIFVQYVKGENK